MNIHVQGAASQRSSILKEIQLKKLECCDCCFTGLFWFQQCDKLVNRKTDCLPPWKEWHLHLASSSIQHNKSALWFKCLWISSATCQKRRSKIDFRPDGLFIPLKLSLKKKTSTTVFHWCKKGSETMRSPTIMKHGPQPGCQRLKMGSWGHSGSTQGVYAWKPV